MSQEIVRIELTMQMNLGGVNCYLIKTEGGFILVDTGISNKCKEIEVALDAAGCKPGDLKLIIITHGDVDHIGNAAYLRAKMGSKIAMHVDDCGMAEKGNMFYNRNKPHFLLRIIPPGFFGFSKSKWFKADLFLEDGQDLLAFGLKAKVLNIPGHSKGSIALLLDSGELISGDLLDNRSKKPGFTQIMDDKVAAMKSVEKLRTFDINQVYPGHGDPFQIDEFYRNIAQ
ncbi:MAG: MBL fold metallo-hydrolase [Anaerolineaceae bacterium]|nr:MBL fold metallo-hydrolase [Anaerolineaceae bacterium]